KLEQPADADIATVPEHFVVENVVAAAEEIRPIARLGDLEQAIVVAVMRAEPVHRALQPARVFAKEIEIPRSLEGVVEGDDHPEAAVDRTDVAHAGVVRLAVVDPDIGGNLAVRRRRLEQRVERAAMAGLHLRIVEIEGVDDRDRAVTGPDRAIVRVGAGHAVVIERARGETERRDVLLESDKSLLVAGQDEAFVVITERADRKSVV